MSEREKTTQQEAAVRSGASEDSKAIHTIRIQPMELSFQTNEALKMLRANIQFSGYGLKALAVTSCQANEGKSFISFELARSLAELGERTLYLDCDIRNSVAQARLGVTEKLPGLSDFLWESTDRRYSLSDKPASSAHDFCRIYFSESGGASLGGALRAVV